MALLVTHVAQPSKSLWDYSKRKPTSFWKTTIKILAKEPPISLQLTAFLHAALTTVCWFQGHLEHEHSEVPPAAVFKTPLTDFDALIVLREEALPYPDRAVPGSTKGLSSKSGEEDDGGDEDELSCHKKARARLHSIPKGEPLTSNSSKSQSMSSNSSMSSTITLVL